jgi:hypothetical protein
LQKNYGVVGVKLNGNEKSIVMINATGGKPIEAAIISLTQKTIYFKAECDFTDKKDVADFFYSLDGKTWNPIGTQLKMAYTLPHFMGYRFGLFNYATKDIGGFVDFDWFRVTDEDCDQQIKTGIMKYFFFTSILVFIFIPSIAQTFTIRIKQPVLNKKNRERIHRFYTLP